MKRFILLCIISCMCLLTTNAQKVGLVLSGGGAKGLAHIAVIRALEENGIPIDYIAGTSMGAIVGGLYAAGYSPDQMDELFKSDQFKFWWTGQIEEEYRYFYSKFSDDPSWIEFDISRKAEKLKIIPPTNLIPEGQMDFAFMEMFSSSSAICKGDFNQLFVPFFCIATDVHNNREVVMRQGDMGEAVRASMTFPFFFKPIEIDGNLVFDGGIVNNFPVQNMKELFAPDIIIGHSVANNPKKPDPDNIMTQIENMIMKKTDYTISPDEGIFIRTTFNNISLLDFKKIDQIESAGQETMNEAIEQIKERISRRVRPEELAQKRNQFNMKKPTLNFQNIQVEGVDAPMQRKFVIQSLKHKENVIDLKTFKREYFKLVASPQIKSLRPVASFNPETGYFDLHVITKPNNPMLVKLGGTLSSQPISQIFLSGDYRIFNESSYTLSANMYFGRFYSSAKLGTRIDFPTSLPFYLSGYLTMHRWDYYSSTTEFVFEDVRPPYIVQNENNFRTELGFPVRTRGKFTIGGSVLSSTDKYYLIESIKADDKTDRTNFDALTATTSIQSNSFNDKQFPTEGISSSFTFNFISGKEKYLPGTTSEYTRAQNHTHNYYLAKANYDRYFRLSKHFSFGFMAEAVYSNKKLFSNYVSTSLAAPAFNPTPHSRTMYLANFHANKYVASGLKCILRVSDGLHFRAEAYGFSPINKIREIENHAAIYAQPFWHINLMGSGSLVYQTALGPISISANYYEKDLTRLFIAVNFGYILFNNRGF